MTKLDIISDPICPWCYIGKIKLDRALKKYPEHDFIIEWHPFQLNPSMPSEGMDRREYLEAKFGGKEEAVRVYSDIVNAAETAGVEINFEGIQRTPSTLNAHRLLHWGALEGKQDAVVDRLFKAYFRKGQDISNHDVLVEIALSTGMNAELTRRLLKADSDVNDIQDRDAAARERGVSGVPCFVIGNHYVIQGAQDTELWEKVITELSDAHNAATGRVG